LWIRKSKRRQKNGARGKNEEKADEMVYEKK
jgi:hypothetical protein